MAILCFIGVLGLILIFIPTSGGNSESKEETDSLTEYKLMLEGELVDMCEQVSGVGKCKVMITFERGAENVYKGSQLTESSPPKVLGVSVICTGGASESVKAELTGMICALFSIGANRVAILPMEK